MVLMTGGGDDVDGGSDNGHNWPMPFESFKQAFLTPLTWIVVVTMVNQWHEKKHGWHSWLVCGLRCERSQV